MKIEKDEIFLKKKKESISTISFLKALKKNLDQDLAFKVAKDAFEYYMTSTYQEVLKSTKIGSQNRFDTFRKFYEDYAKKTPYLEIIESSSNILKVRYNRCPFYEIAEDEDLEKLSYAFCLSDLAFTTNVLPNVEFLRKNVIAKGDQYCDNTWIFKK